MKSLLQIINEIRIVGKVNPYKDLELFIKTYIKQIRKVIEDFDEYIDINDWEFTPGTLEDPQFPDYIVISSKINDCYAIGFTSNIKNELEGDGPINSGQIIEIAGFRIQYQTMTC